MQTVIERNEDTLLVYLSGELDHHSAAHSRMQIDDAIACMQPKKAILDFSGITFMDSSGIGLVMGRYKLLSTMQCPLELCGLSPHVYKVMRLAGLEQIAVLQKAGRKPEMAEPKKEAEDETH